MQARPRSYMYLQGLIQRYRPVRNLLRSKSKSLLYVSQLSLNYMESALANTRSLIEPLLNMWSVTKNVPEPNPAYD